MLVKFKKRWIKATAIWIISMAVLGLAYLVLVVPMSITASRQRQAILDKAKEIETVSDYVSEKNLKDLKKQTDMLLDRLGKFTAEMHLASECTYAISNIAERLGTRNFSTKQDAYEAFSKVENCELLLAARIDISCKGSSDQFLRLVNEYERYRPIVLIDKFSIEAADDGLNKIKMSLTILIDNRRGKLTSYKNGSGINLIWRGV